MFAIADEVPDPCRSVGHATDHLVALLGADSVTVERLA
jgi:hypothetical protein